MNVPYGIGILPTTSKSFSLYRELLKPLWVIYQKMAIYLQRLKEFPIQAEGFPSGWNDTGISISLYCFVPIDIYSEFLIVIRDCKNSEKGIVLIIHCLLTQFQGVCQFYGKIATCVHNAMY